MTFKLCAAIFAATFLAGQPAFTDIKAPEGKEVPVRLEEALSSNTAQTGDRFSVSLDEDVKLQDGTVLHAG